MAVSKRKERGKWGFQKFWAGKRFARYQWDTRAEAEKAYRRFLTDLENFPQIPSNALVKVVNEYLIASRDRGRSSWRLQALSLNFERIIVPFFGATRIFTEITHTDIEKFVAESKKRGVKNSTVWHYIVDLKALFNWAICKPPGERLATENPVTYANLDQIRRRKVVKLPMDPAQVDFAEYALSGIDRIYFNFVRYMGLRKDEANRARWVDLDVVNRLFRVEGTKTEESEEILPVPPVLQSDLASLSKITGDNELLFPGQKGKVKGKKVYHRRRMFERIYKRTGIKLMPKDLRDYYCNEIASQTEDPIVLMKLMRHKSLATTTKYARTVRERMREAVQNLGVTLGCNLGVDKGSNRAQNDNFRKIPPVKKPQITPQVTKGKVGGGGGTRTLDNADMSREDSDELH